MTHYLVAEILGIFFLEAESVVICLLFPVLELDYEIYLLFFLYTLYSVKCLDIDDSDASKLYKVSGYLGDVPMSVCSLIFLISTTSSVTRR